MKHFAVTVRTLTDRVIYSAIGTSSSAVALDALSLFGGLCGVSVVAL